MSVLGIDIGTSGCKGVVLAADGHVLAQTEQNYAHKVRTEGVRVEITADVFADGMASIIRQLAETVKRKDPIRAIALSTHGETLIPVGADDRAIRPAILSMDRRSRDEVLQMRDAVGTLRFYEITGTPLHSQYPAPKIMWLRRHEPEESKRTVRYCSVQDYLNGLLGAPGCADYSLASRFGMLDVKRRSWSETILNAVELDASMLPKPVCAGTVLGEIPTKLAQALNLEKNVAIVAGGHDQPCASLALGARQRRITVSAGSYECAAITTDRPLNDSEGMRYGLNSYCHVLKDQYITLAFFASGLTVQWVIDRFCRYEREKALQQGADVHELLESMSMDRPSGVCMSPYIYGSMNPEWNERATATISGLTADADVGTLYRAALEGTACELDLNLRVLEKLAGGADEIVMGGGGTRSSKWMQIRADVAARSICRIRGSVDASCLGAAVLAGIGIGQFAGPDDAFGALQGCAERFNPNDAAAYAVQKREYLKFHRAGLASELQR